MTPFPLRLPLPLQLSLPLSLLLTLLPAEKCQTRRHSQRVRTSRGPTPLPLSTILSPSLCLAVKELRQWWGVGEGVFGFLISHYAGWKILVRLLVASSVFKMKNEATAACGTHQRHICVCGCMCVCTAGNLSHSLGIAPPSLCCCLPACLLRCPWITQLI